MKQSIKQKARDLGADLVGVLNLEDYDSPRSPDPCRYLETVITAPATVWGP